MTLHLLPNTTKVWEQFASFYEARGLERPPRPMDGIWVGAADGTLIGGCCLYPSDGPYVFAGHAASSPTVNRRVVLRALRIGAVALMTYAATRSKNVVCAVPVYSIFKALARVGLVGDRSLFMFGSATFDTGQRLREERPTIPAPPPAVVRKKQRRRTRRKK